MWQRSTATHFVTASTGGFSTNRSVSHPQFLISKAQMRKVLVAELKPHTKAGCLLFLLVVLFLDAVWWSDTILPQGTTLSSPKRQPKTLAI